MTTNGQYAIDLHHVEKTYRGKVHALRGIEMRVHPGEIFGLLGPNGAGKSTLVKIMMTVVRPTRAEGTLLGEPVGDKATLRRVGYLPEHHRIPSYLTGRQVLDYYGALAGVPRSDRRRRGAELLELVGMQDWASRKIGTYSKGMMQRIGIGQALINDPDLVVLDEPTDGVDPVGRRDIRDLLAEMKRRGKTVFLNSHLLSELEMVCDRVAILVQGDVSQQGTIDDLTADSLRYEIVVEGGMPAWLGEYTDLRPGTSPETPFTRDATERSTLFAGGVDPKPIQAVLDRLRAEGRTIVRVQPVRENLEDLFMRAVTDPTTGVVKTPGAARPPAAKGGDA